MSKINKLLNQKKMTLIVSLPRNDYELAKTAWENGADVVKVHVNLNHHASKNNFLDLESEKPVLMKILKDCPVPVGIVIADHIEVAENTLNDILKLPFDFISLYGQHMPVALGKNRKIATSFAIDYSYTFDDVKRISRANVTDVIELSTLRVENYGTRLSLNGLLTYAEFVRVSKLPTILPTQHKILLSDLKPLYDIGIKAIMIGAVVTGSTKESIGKSVKRFRKAVDDVNNTSKRQS